MCFIGHCTLFDRYKFLNNTTVALGYVSESPIGFSLDKLCQNGPKRHKYINSCQLFCVLGRKCQLFNSFKVLQ